MLSFTARLLIAASAVLIAFLGLTGLALDRAFRDSAESAVRERLQAQIYMLLGAASVESDGGLVMPRTLPEARLMLPDSGLYALVTDVDGDIVWRSESLLGLRLAPLPAPPRPGQWQFTRHHDAGERELLLNGFSVTWELGPERTRGYTFWIAENARYFAEQVRSFRRSLGAWLLGAAGVLLAVQVLVLRWTLRPLRQVAREIRAIESGRQSLLSGRYPRELQPLTANLNQLVREGRAQLDRYRNALGDLAHSLKTPLAVLASVTRQPLPAEDLRSAVRSQIERMNQTVDYQLQRAAAAGRRSLSAGVDVAEPARRVKDSLDKVYAERALELELAIVPGTQFPGEQGDLLELLGNLADNACKWAHSRVRIGAWTEAGLVLQIEDDGPGIPAEQRRGLLDRGRRADSRMPGHGIGLAVVRDLVEEVYQGRLEIGDSPLGGARVRIELPE